MIYTMVTQTGEIINYGNILRVVFASGEYEGESAYAILAQPVGMSSVDVEDEEAIEKLIQLAIYDSEEKCIFVYDNFVKWLNNTVQPVFEFPASVDEE